MKKLHLFSAKKSIVLTAMMALALLLTPMKGRSQVFLDEEDDDSPRIAVSEVTFLIVPLQGIDSDQTTPLGDGLLLLGGMGAAYLFAKRKKKERE